MGPDHCHLGFAVGGWSSTHLCIVVLCIGWARGVHVEACKQVQGGRQQAGVVEEEDFQQGDE